MRRGSMPVHLLLHGPSSAGKSYTVGIVLSLLPKAAFHLTDAGSPRQLIYDTADLRHRVLVFSEADSLPAGEDNPAASAVRTLLQEHQLRYKVTVWNPTKRRYETQEVVKEGPTVLFTTSVGHLGKQLATRMLTVDAPDDPAQIRAALAAQAVLETEGSPEPDQDLIDYQSLLQEMAPWDVQVPFATDLANAMGNANPAPRATRDFSKVVSLTKAVALLRFEHRDVDSSGRLVADIDDYAAVFGLLDEAYSTSVTDGASRRVRDVVRAVAALSKRSAEPVTLTGVAKYLGIHKGTASKHVSTAIDCGWLTNTNAWRKGGYAADLILAEPLPAKPGLPAPEALGRVAVLRRVPDKKGSTRQ
jgi:hypothetical protein